MGRLESNPTPSVLVWARTTSGLSLAEASRKVGVNEAKLAAWEAGDQRPTFAQLRKLGSVYKRPVAAFYLQEPPKWFAAMRDFRRHPEGQESVVSPSLTYEIRRAYDRREWALELLAQLDEKPKEITLTLELHQPIEEAASQVRRFLGVSASAQALWEEQAFGRWRACIEQAGVLTFEMTTVKVEEARGFSVGLKPMPVAVANIKDSRSARSFTLLHELVHVLLDSGGVCDLEERGRGASAQTETFCNRVAGAVIYPMTDLVQTEIVARHHKGRVEWTDQELHAIAYRFGGSRESALIRLVSLGLSSQTFCDARRAKFREEYRSERERRAQKDEGFAPPHQLALLSAGPLFVSLVVENFNRERITTSDFSDYLQIRTKHIPEVQKEYAGFGE
jgi:Zn-dependent peptidase ImmA (M78 family)